MLPYCCRFLPFAVLLATSLFTGPIRADVDDTNQQVEEILPQLEQIVDRYREAFWVPGTAVAIVTKDRQYYISSGYRKPGNGGGKIRPDTMFQLASVSKPITATYVAMLKSEGIVTWDTKMYTCLPWVSFADVMPTYATTLRDLLSQRSGLPIGAGDFLEVFGFQQDFILSQMKLISTKANFQKEWGYANFGITLAGVAAAAADGPAFPKSIKQHLFNPLDMKSATARYRQFDSHPNRALITVAIDEVPTPFFVRNADRQAPGGGINGTAQDLAAFVQFHVNKGRVGNKQLVAEADMEAMYEKLSSLGLDHFGGNPLYYGLCWEITTDDENRRVISHAGAFGAGVRSTVSFRPDSDIGIAVLTNGYPNVLPEAIASAFYDLFDYGSVPDSELARFKTISATLYPPRDTDVFGHMLETGPTINGDPLSAYAGTYRSEYTGSISFKVQRIPRTNQTALYLTAGPLMPATRIQVNPDNHELTAVVKTAGGGIVVRFSNKVGNRFNTVDFVGLKEAGGTSLQRFGP